MANSPYTVVVFSQSTGNVVPNAAVQIYNRNPDGSSGSLAVIYSDEAGANPISQPGATANAQGVFVFYADGKAYNAVYNGFTQPIDVGITENKIPNAIGGIAPYEFNTVADAKAGALTGGKTVTLEAGDVIRIKERGNALFDVISGTGTSDEKAIIAHGSLSLSFVMRETTNLSYKFALQKDTANGEKFLELRNTVDNIQLLSIPDGTQSGDAWVFGLPPDVRRDSHAYLATAGTFGGENDIDFRTYLYSDYILLRGKTTYQNESFQILFDTKPSRNDSTKKNGTGGGGLSVADDVYAFDAAMIVPSNRTDTPITFPALPVKFEQYVELKRRTTGVFGLKLTPNVNDITITDSGTGNELGKVEASGITIGGRKRYSSSTTDIQATIGTHEISGTHAINNGANVTYRLVANGSIAAGRLRVLSIGSAGSGFGVRDIAFQSNGTTVTTQVIGVDNLVAEISANLTLNSGVLDLVIGYSGGYGGSAKVQVSVDWDARTA